jgi:hypothetical protein
MAPAPPESISGAARPLDHWRVRLCDRVKHQSARPHQGPYLSGRYHDKVVIVRITATAFSEPDAPEPGGLDLFADLLNGTYDTRGMLSYTPCSSVTALKLEKILLPSAVWLTSGCHWSP